MKRQSFPPVSQLFSQYPAKREEAAQVKGGENLCQTPHKKERIIEKKFEELGIEAGWEWLFGVRADSRDLGQQQLSI